MSCLEIVNLLGKCDTIRRFPTFRHKTELNRSILVFTCPSCEKFFSHKYCDCKYHCENILIAPFTCYRHGKDTYKVNVIHRTIIIFQNISQYFYNNNNISQYLLYFLSFIACNYKCTHHCRYQEKWIFPSYKAKLNLTLFSFENLITDAYSD